MLFRFSHGGQLVTLGAAGAKQQIQPLQDEFNTRFDGLHQAPATLLQEEKEETKMRKSNGSQLRMQMAKAVEETSIPQEMDRTTLTDLTLLASISDNLRRMESFEGAGEKKERNQKSKRRNSN